MNNITLKQLRYVQALSQTGHFGRAAELCTVSQPALSMQIKELEAQLGSALFERSRKEVRLTGFGEEFAGRVRTILRSVDELADLAQASKYRLAGRLRLGVIPTIAPYLLPAIIAELKSKHPDLDLRVRETMTHKLVQEVEDGRLDAAIVALPISAPSLTETAIFDEPFVLVRQLADKDNPVPNREKLQEMRLLLLEEGHCFREQALSFCSAAAIRPNNMLDGSSLTTLVQMVAAGMGVTLIPQMAVAIETRTAEVSIAEFPPPEPKRTIGMIWRKTTPMAQKLEDVAETVRSVA